MPNYTTILQYLETVTATTADYVLINTGGNNKKITLANFISSLGLGGGGGGGITTLNTLTALTQTFATGSSGTDFNISSATSTHTFNIPSASATNRGLLTSANFSAFSGKQDAITLTTTGTSGAATLVGATLNIPQYGSGNVTSVSGTSPISSSGGTTPAISIQDAVADGSTKGAASFTASDFNSSSGVISIDYTNGQSASASNKGFLTSSNWSTFNGKQDAITLTTMGAGGAATLIGSTLNIPVYTFSGINDINGDSSASQSLITGTAGTDFTITTAAGTTTFDIPDSNGVVNRGLLNKSDWTLFNGKQAALSGTGIVKSTAGTISYLTDNTSNWDTAYTNRITSLTTTGTSGAATLSSNTLNIPQYSGKVSQTFTEGVPSLGSAILAEPITCNFSQITNTGTGLFNQRLSFIAVYVPKSMTITGVKWVQNVTGVYTANNYNGVGLYTYSSGTYTLVASSTNDGNIWKPASLNTLISKSFSSTYSANAGVYFIAALYCQSAQTTAPAVISTPSTYGTWAMDFTNSAKIQGLLFSQPSFPSTFAASSASTTTPGLYFALY